MQCSTHNQLRSRMRIFKDVGGEQTRYRVAPPSSAGCTLEQAATWRARQGGGGGGGGAPEDLVVAVEALQQERPHLQQLPRRDEAQHRVRVHVAGCQDLRRPPSPFQVLGRMTRGRGSPLQAIPPLLGFRCAAARSACTASGARSGGLKVAACVLDLGSAGQGGVSWRLEAHQGLEALQGGFRRQPLLLLLLLRILLPCRQ